MINTNSNLGAKKQKCAMCFNIFIGALVLFFVLLAGMFFYMEGQLRGIIGGQESQTPAPSPSPTPTLPPALPTPSSVTSVSPSPSALPHSDLIHPRTPLPDTLVKSPLTVEGEARGN